MQLTRHAPALEQMTRPAARPGQPATPGGFAKALDLELQRASGLRFSAHAQTRLAQREVQFTAEDVQRLEDAVSQAAAKGARDALVLMDDTALIVNVPSRTVVTALNTDAPEANVFTNIDSAVVVPSTANESTNNNEPDPKQGGSRVADRLTQRLL